MKTEKIILFLTLFLLVSAPISTNAQVISSLNEQNTKIAKQEKAIPKKQTQFSAQGATKVSIDTTTIYYAYLDSAQNCINEKIGVKLKISYANPLRANQVIPTTLC